ncbi:hypothetical protein Xkoz_03727 [Xenorhabdus kozodoii]|uniref:Uncharacterized protein n=1 Tax=Xenorhabdus kozodoii TaxID=351676 RepID=A0A2D0KXP2_9GAMM|nr:hypothetical protein Xkoz_03727 [Xenorhabdus kozodoii]
MLTERGVPPLFPTGKTVENRIRRLITVYTVIVI